MPEQIIHIGFPKTGTTYLQTTVFPFLDVSFVGFKESASILGKLVYADRLDYEISEVVKKISDYQDDKPLLFSFENLAGSPFYYKGLNRSSIPDKLKDLGFTKIIITIRNQQSAIDSYYRQYVVQGGTLNFSEFLDLENKRPWQSKYFNLNYLKYDALLSVYEEVFGRENVLVLSQEMLMDTQNVYFEKLMRFMNLPKMQIEKAQEGVNVSLTNLSLYILRFVNHFTYSSISPHHMLSDRIKNTYFFKFLAILFDPYIGRFFSKKSSFIKRKNLESQLNEIYASSNESLYSNFGIDYR